MDDLISRQAALDMLDEQIEMCNKALSAFDISLKDEYAVKVEKASLKAYKEQLENILSVQPEPHWIPCSERLPSETVIATVETKPFKHRYVCEAVWIPRWTRKVLFDEWEDCSEYKEDDDEYYALEGWYERVHNWDEYAYVAIDDNVIAWLPLTKPYGGGDAK